MRALVHFLLIGACLFAASRWLEPNGDATSAERQIAITADSLERLRRETLARTGRLPNAAELDALVDADIDDEILFREALALGLAERDAIVQRRLVQNMGFLGGDAEGDPDALIREAFAMGMHRMDIVVRRRLVQRMRLAIESGGRGAEPSDAELAAHLAENRARYTEPARAAFSQVFFSRDQRGDATAADARAALARLRERPDAALTGELGDAFLGAMQQPLQSDHEIAKLFGPEFARAVLALPPGSWTGPIRSSYGFHLVRVRDRRPEVLLPLSEVRDKVRHALLAARGQHELRRALDELRSRYQVTVER